MGAAESALSHHHELDHVPGADVLDVALKSEDALPQPVDDGLPLPCHPLALQELGLCRPS